MTEEKRKKPVAWGAIGWAVVGAAALGRALWKPHRALIRDGYAEVCPGKDCSADLVVAATEDAQPIYTPVDATVLGVWPDRILLAAATEAAVLEYSAPSGWHLQVSQGQRLSAGAELALARKVAFSVYRLNQDGSLTPYEPSSWLAVHGMRISAKFQFSKRPDAQWCEQGRHLEVPQKVAECGMSIPPPSGYALLPVNIEMK